MDPAKQQEERDQDLKRDERLKRHREANARRRENETDDERDERLKKQREIDARRRQHETEDKRNERLENRKKAYAQRRKQETADKHTERVENQRKIYAQKREQETNDKRGERLKKQRDADAHRRLEETDEQRNIRLERLKLTDKKRRLEETDDERIERLTARQKSRRQSIDAETEPQRAVRLEKRNEWHRKNINAKLQKSQSKLQNLAQQILQDENVVEEQFCGTLDAFCPKCGTKFFQKESSTRNNLYTLCCREGKVVLPEQDFPNMIEMLMTDRDKAHSKNFMDNIRAINSSFAFASMGADIDLPKGNGPYCFRIHGQIYHRTGSFLLPNENEQPKYAQLYIFDSEAATNTRLLHPGNESCNKDLLKKILDLLTQINIFARSYKMLYEVEELARQKAIENGTEMPSISMAIKNDRSKDIRRYNSPNQNEVAIIFEDVEGEPPSERDILVHCRPNHRNQNTNTVKRLSILDVNLDAMVYPLFFPREEGSWGPNMPLKTINEIQNSDEVDDVERDMAKKRKRISQMQYYSYKLMIRNKFNPLLNGGRLTQQYIVDAYTRMEASRLMWVRTNQKTLRAESYSGLTDHLNNIAGENGLKVGKTVILPSSFEGSPRNYHQRYQDAMAIVTKFGKPDLFITMTCNSKWKEVIDNLEPWQKAEHRPDLIARVFRLKLNNLLEDINQGLFGKLKAMIHTIEFQKRGLPHAHILITLDHDSKIRTDDDIDKIVCAEIPDKEKYPILHNIVIKNMIHTPCGTQKLNAPCMDQGKCTKNFPKEFSDVTLSNVDGYPKYKRRHTESIERNGIAIDNRWVVPYNPFLLKKFNCHINVEVCASIKSVKYLYKYVYKGHDRASINVRNNEVVHNEVDKFLDARYVSAPEAIWRIFSFSMHQQSHAIIRLAVHLPNEQTIYFNEADESETLAQKMNKNSTLIAWFNLNKANNTIAKKLLYREIPDHFTFTKGEWKRRVGFRKLLGRMYSVSIRQGERYYLRLLLLHVPGATGFEFLRTVNDVVYPTFKDAARARGLLLDDNVWRSTLEEAVNFNMPQQLRGLFAYICVFGPPSNPRTLWDEFKNYMMEDFCLRVHNKVGDCNQCESFALKEIQDIFVINGKSYEDFGLPIPAIQVPDFEQEFDVEVERKNADDLILNLNEDQKRAFDEIKAAIEDSSLRSKCFFIDGPGGSGKTYLYRTLIHYVRGIGKVVMPSATTGIAANLLNKGRTIHSLFGLPIPLNETSISRITMRSKAASALRETDLFIIDECTMASNYAVNTIDKLLKEIMDNNIPFGGRVVLFGGDFRQCLPIIPHGVRPAIVQGSMKFSKPWKDGDIRHLQLKANMRSTDSNYSDWLLKLGDGILKCDYDFPEELSVVEIPSEYICDDIVSLTFGEKITSDVIKEMSKRAILCPKNDDVDRLNQKVMDILEGEYVTYLSDDSVKEDTEEEQDNFNVEFLNSITPSGMPNHCLKLKVGTIIMLLRNLNTKQGLCNGTRLMVTSLRPNLIEAEVLTGSAEKNKVLIPRIDLCPSETGLPFKLNRRQFPVKPAFAMTINKSQGQTLSKVGIYLPEPVFGHGQLYVAFSRVRQKSDVRIQILDTPLQGKLLKSSDKVFTQNIVFREVF